MSCCRVPSTPRRAALPRLPLTLSPRAFASACPRLMRPSRQATIGASQRDPCGAPGSQRQVSPAHATCPQQQATLLHNACKQEAASLVCCHRHAGSFKEGKLGHPHQLLNGEQGRHSAEVGALRWSHKACCEQLRQLSSPQRFQHSLTQAGQAMRARCCKQLRKESQQALRSTPVVSASLQLVI